MGNTVTEPEAEKLHPPFLFAEECGLALLQHRGTGRRFWIEQGHWRDIVAGLQAGWQPGARWHRNAKNPHHGGD